MGEIQTLQRDGHPDDARLVLCHGPAALDDAQCHDRFDTSKSLTVELNPDGKIHTYHLDPASSPEYQGLLTGVAIEPVVQPRPGEEIAIRSIVLSSARR